MSPIRPENLARYPANWPEIVARIRRRAGNKCENCGVQNYELGGRTRDGRWHWALPLAEKLLRLEWPEPGQHAWCTDGKHTVLLRVVRIVCTTGHLDHVPEHCADENLVTTRSMTMRMLVKYGNERLTVAQAATRVGISSTAMRFRLERGWPKEKLFSPDRFNRDGKARTGCRASNPPSRNARPMESLREVVREHGSPIRAALAGEISGEEYLRAEQDTSGES